MQQADLLAERLAKEGGSDLTSQVARAYELCFGRSPSVSELRVAIEFIQAEGLPQFARAMLNANEFVLSREKLVMNSLLNRRQFLGSTGQRAV